MVILYFILCRIHQVGLKLPNSFGLYDMHGNVLEWCWDWNGDPPFESHYGPSDGTSRLISGGSWLDSAKTTSFFIYSFAWPFNSGSEVGFRLVRP